MHHLPPRARPGHGLHRCGALARFSRGAGSMGEAARVASQGARGQPDASLPLRGGHLPQMPSGGPPYRRRRAVEPGARSHRTVRLFRLPQDQGLRGAPPPGRGDARRGEALVTQIGCLGCHAIARLEKEEPTFRRRFGPNLDGIGSKARPEWIYAWLKDPKKYFPETRMPNLRLTDAEARDITEYLTTLKVEGWTAGEPAIDPELLDR